MKEINYFKRIKNVSFSYIRTGYSVWGCHHFILNVWKVKDNKRINFEAPPKHYGLFTGPAFFSFVGFGYGIFWDRSARIGRKISVVKDD